MRRTLLALLAGAATLATVAPAVAQPYGPPPGDRMHDHDWDRDHDRGDRDHDRDRMGDYGVGRDFWRGAPATPWERVQWLQDRINRGRQDRSLNYREAARAQHELDRVRFYAQDHRRRYGDLRPEDREYIQRQLDYVSRLIHWERHDH